MRDSPDYRYLSICGKMQNSVARDWEDIEKEMIVNTRKEDPKFSEYAQRALKNWRKEKPNCRSFEIIPMMKEPEGRVMAWVVGAYETLTGDPQDHQIVRVTQIKYECQSFIDIELMEVLRIIREVAHSLAGHRRDMLTIANARIAIAEKRLAELAAEDHCQNRAVLVVIGTEDWRAELELLRARRDKLLGAGGPLQD